VSFLVGLGFFQGHQLGLGEDDALLGNLSLQRLEPFAHGLQIMALPHATHAGR